MKFWNGAGAAFAIIALTLAAAAQTPAPPATCTTAPTSVTAFNVERVVSLNGAPAAVSVGYTTDSPALINDVAVLIAGSVIDYSAGATGTLTVPPTATAPGNGGGTGPTILVKFSNGAVALPNTTIQASLSPFLLDASGSTGTGALTYSWSAASGTPVAFVSTDTAGKILVQFPGPGGYTINLKVTDASGASATFSITLQNTGRPQ